MLSVLQVTEKDLKVPEANSDVKVPDIDMEDPETNKDKVLEELVCPICLDTYRKPRTLRSCLHTFCEICLIEYMARENRGNDRLEFECPVCRIKVQGPELKCQINDWVRDLPVNHVINSLIGKDIKRVIDFVEIRYKCDPCFSQAMEKEARHFCVECNENLCTDCVRYHKHLKQTRTHNIISYDAVNNDPKQAINLTTSLKCLKHPEKDIEFFCRDENTLCCISCATVRHRNCAQVLEITCLEQDKDNSEEAIETLKDLKHTIEVMNDLTRKNEETLKQDIEKVKTDFQKYKDEMLQQLNLLELGVKKTCTAYELGSEASNADILARNHGMSSAITASTKQLENVLQHGTTVQKFVTLHKTWDQIREYKKILDRNVQNLKAQSVSLKVQKLSEMVPDGKSLAEVSFQEQPVGFIYLLGRLRKCQTNLYLMKLKWTRVKLHNLQCYVKKHIEEFKDLI